MDNDSCQTADCEMLNIPISGLEAIPAEFLPPICGVCGHPLGAPEVEGPASA
jgi:hypothetical protein